MHEKGDGIAAGESPLYWVNYANLERGILVNIPTDFYAPYDRLFAKASRQLFVNNFKGIRAHLYASGAYWRESSIEGFRLIYDIDPPDNQWDYLPASSVKAVKAGPPDADLKPVIMDENLETVYIVEVNSNKPAVIEWEFENAINVCGLLIMNPGESRPEHINIAFHTERDGWIDMPETLEITGHFWSGPRIFYEGFEYLQQLRFRPPPGGISILRMTISSTETSDRVMIPEALLLIESANTEEATTVDPVEIARWIAQIHQSKASRVYAPRWIAEQMHGQLAAGIDLRASYYLDRDMQALPREDDPSAPYLDLAARTALLIENRDLVRSRAHLEGLNIRWDEIAGRSHTLFIIQPLDAATHLETVVPIFWTDRGLFAGNGRHDRIRRADQLYQRFSSTRDSEKRQQLIEACVRLAPEHEVAWNDYHTLMNGQLTPDLIQLYKHSRPQIVLEGKFAGGIELAGLTITPQMVRAGELVTIDYFWRIKPGADITKWSTFVHFLKGKNILLQDDHNLSEEVERMVVANQTFAHLFKISRTVRAPESSGKLDIGLGLVNPLTQKRARVDSPHELRKNVLVATDALDVR